ncbi:Xylose isomerase domain protein TIM barrel [Delftia acidovorans SPH-1]|uniref:Xylose isomerase domain protein TIM barrel n=1 Tax=Delftia acidovorans (strain DSM 14801 / SPH-1) TaxID=398578 RepID=A9BWN0_DELAS|nr:MULTISPECIES: sugar phosphate isomerase/epimerase [Delftia]MBA4002228.1 sugar phosphate isomerase/epimerase [Delftia sp.]ABX36557.1 Xylose isomerase domain protein TIM barrel [Delftia acidovorans SPH-1]MCP4015155.1 sugar phosphate isomerase/epimerase [Delftia sp.]MCP4535015.1 sugar phosphate isomerase/epimerase [Delftia sp.]OLE06589.1 MAG: AP endonuclease [Delftia sp. 13_1_20CM_4_67_18]
MQTIKGPSLHLAQFADNKAPFNSLEDIARWAAGVGFKGLQIPAWDQRLFDVATAASSQTYCDDVNGMLASHGLVASELTTHIFGQLVAVHPAYDAMCDSFAPEALRGNPAARTAWALEQLKLSASASRRMGLSDMGTFSGSFAWPYLFPFPQRPAGLIETAFEELARRWRPILDACDEQGVNLCYEIHPSEDLHDGTSFERFHELVGQHTRCKILFDPSHFVLQQLNYLDYIDIYREHIRMFHVKDAEFLPSGRQGIYGGYSSWLERAGRFRSLGDGQVDFKAIFSKFAQYDYQGWASLEWECCLKDQEDGAREGVDFINRHIIRVTDKIFDDFAGAPVDQRQINAMLGIA